MEIFRGLSINKTIEKIVLADNDFTFDDILLIDELCNLIKSRPNLKKYDLRFNEIQDKGA